MRKHYLLLLLIFSALLSSAQETEKKKGPKWVKRVKVDTSAAVMNLDAVYNRPFLQFGKVPVTVGGYLETNTSYFKTDGVSDGWSFQIPRLTLFVASSFKSRLKFLTEIEFEEGGREINIEFASLDVEIHSLANFRAGIIMNPIGSFNQNHDGPKWEFVDRPLSSTTIIPATWSNVGAGFYGKYALNNWVWAYELYATNGFDDKIISNPENRTSFAASKENGERFNESFNGSPLVTAKVAVRQRQIGELGISWMGGIYNKFKSEGIRLDKKRRADLIALDFNTTIPKLNTRINTEWVMALLDVPSTYTQQFGNRQLGFYLDIVQPVWRTKIWQWENATLNVAFRTEYVDYNVGRFTSTGGNISDHIIAIVPAVSFRPSPQTVLRVNYRHQWQTDLLGNPPSITDGFQIGVSTYF